MKFRYFRFPKYLGRYLFYIVKAGYHLYLVARILARNKISGMPVVDEGKVVGVVSEADILTAAGDTTVDWVMSSDIVSVTPDTPVGEITAILKQRSIKRVLVTDRAGDLVGIVSRADIVAAMALD